MLNLKENMPKQILIDAKEIDMMPFKMFSNVEESSIKSWKNKHQTQFA